MLMAAWLSCGHSVDAAGLRTAQIINPGWKFTLGDPSGAQAVGYNDASWRDVNLPHSFSLPYFLSSKFYTGYGWYRRHFTVSSAWSGERIFLQFEAAFQDAQVYVNGTLIGEHLGGYTGFMYDITSAAVTGDNVIAVRLNNNWNAQIPPRAGDHTFSGGLYRNVYLVVTDPLHVTWYGTFVTTPTLAANAGASSTVRIQTEIRNDNASSTPCTVQTDIVDPNGTIVSTISSTQTIPASTTVTFDQTTPAVSNPLLWHPDHPYLYHAVTTVYNGSTAVDNYNTTFGFRWFSWTAEQGFFLNGAHYYFHGVNVHQDHAGWGDGVTNQGFFRDVQMVKDAGFNFIRGSHYPKAPAFGDACDQIGVLFWSENCFWGLGGATSEGAWDTAGAYPNNAADQAPFEQNVLNTLRDMIRIHRNHPSIIAWSMCNEPFFTSSGTITNMRNLLSEEVALTHQLDPTRPAAIGGAQRPLDSTRIDGLGDVAGYNGGGGESQFQDPGFPNMVTEYGSTVATRPGNYDPGWGSLPLTNGFPTEYAWRSGQSLWCMFDHGSIGGSNLEDMGIVDYFRLPKRGWYWYRNAYKGIAPPVWPVGGTATQLGLAVDKTTLSAVDGTDDAQVVISVLDSSGNRLTNSPPVTLTIDSGPGEFPTGRSITFDPAGNGDASDIAIADGWAAIEFRAYQSGTSVIRASSPGLADATITITSQGSPAFVDGVTPLVVSRPYVRYTGGATSVATMQLALDRPAQASSVASGTLAGQANDGNSATLWQAAATDSNPWWQVSLEATYQVNRIQLTFPAPGNWRYKIDVSQDGTNYTTVVDQSQTTSTDQIRVATGNFGNGVGFVRVRIFGTPAGVPAGLAEVSVGGGSGLTFNANQLGGTIIGTAGSYNGGAAVTKEAAIDGDTSTFFDAPTTSGAWVGVDLGSNTSGRLAKVRYVPRSGYAGRMVGGMFQGANQPDFSDAVTLFTISATPVDGAYASQEITDTGSYRYLRYIGPANGNCNVAELEFYNAPATGATTLYGFESNTNDSSGNGNDGTPTSISYSTGKVGSKAASFNGSTSTIACSFQTSGDFSVAMWVKTTGGSTSGTSTSQWWAGKGLVDGDINGNAADWGTSIVNGKFAFGIGAVNPSQTDVTVLSSATINDNAWHHCAATWNEATGAMSVYVDGVLSGSGTNGAGYPRNNPIAIKIGRVASGSGSISLNGAIDDMRYYDRVLSSTDVASLAAGAAPTTVPGAPASLVAAPGDGLVRLSWPATNGATGYEILRSPTSGSGYLLVGTTFGTSYTDSTPYDGTSYYYVVVATNLTGISADSPEAAATPLAVPALPTGFMATAASSTSIQLSWTDVAINAASYQAEYSPAGANSWTLGSLLPVSSSAYLVGGLSPGASYDFRVMVSNVGGTATTAPVTQTTFTPYQQWKVDNGLSVSTPDSAIPDGDGIPLLLKYATGMAVGSPGVAPASSSSPGANPLALTFHRLSPAPLTYIVEASYDMVTWTPVARLATGSDTWSGTASVAEPATGSPRIVTVTDTVTPNASSKRFLRLRVSP